MWFMNYIIQRLNDASGYFYDVYLEIYGWTWPFYLASYPFYWLSSTFSSLAWNFYDFNDWVDYVAGRVASILTLDNIYSYFSYYFEAAVNAWNWVVNSFSNVWNIVDSWWSTTQYTVLAWIEDAKRGFASLLDQTNTWLASLQSAWDSFKGMIPTIDEVIYWWSDWTGELLSVINTWWSGALLQVQGLINTAFIEREPFWAGWQDWRDKVTEFFTSPLDWLESKFTDWFLGAE